MPMTLLYNQNQNQAYKTTANKLHEWCEKWLMEINKKKTTI